MLWWGLWSSGQSTPFLLTYPKNIQGKHSRNFRLKGVVCLFVCALCVLWARVWGRVFVLRVFIFHASFVRQALLGMRTACLVFKSVAGCMLQLTRRNPHTPQLHNVEPASSLAPHGSPLPHGPSLPSVPPPRPLCQPHPSCPFWAHTCSVAWPVLPRPAWRDRRRVCVDPPSSSLLLACS